MPHRIGDFDRAGAGVPGENRGVGVVAKNTTWHGVVPVSLQYGHRHA